MAISVFFPRYDYTDPRNYRLRWKYCGNVRLDVEEAMFTIKDEVAWLSAVETIIQADHIQMD
jgi:hypothetical protein